MSKEKSIVPELRFPKFEKNWMYEPFSEIYAFLTTNSFSRAKLNYEKGNVKNIHYGDIHTKFSTLFDISTEDVPYVNPDISLKKIKKENYCQVGDIVFADASEDLDDVGKSIEIINLDKEKLLAGLHTLLARQNSPRKLITGFGGFLFKSPGIRSQIKREAQGAKVLGISGTRLLTINVFYPDNESEQQKIADCLSSLDALIAAHRDKLDALRAHKKGLMQNLFPQEGETVPRYRFEGFEGAWGSEPLQEICKLVRGPFGGALKKEIFVEEGYAVYEQSHAIYSDFSNFRYRINDEKYHELKRFSVRASDLIMSCSGTMGKFSMIPSDFEEGVINQALLKLTVKTGYDVLFIKTSLETETNQKKLLSQSAGGAIKNVVSVSQIRILELSVPRLKEQQKIAECLSTVDELITAQEDRIAQLQEHKRGLMQGLFPKTNG